ncbi:MAG TPA: hypothetical protein VJA19_15340 [Pseudomonas sp.]|nr:hypothetical protein [Pseudomonas sp.]
MSGPTITAVPTLTQGDDLSPAQLREALARANSALLDLTLQHHLLKVSASALNQELGAMCEAQLAGDTGTVLQIVERVANNYRGNMERLRAGRSVH